MKAVIFAAALMLSGAALAQDDTQMPATPDASADQPGQQVAPGNDAPERDARGIPVISAPATAPAGANQPFTVPPGAQVVLQPQQQVFAPQPAANTDLPPCTREVTDHCVQTYERHHGPRSAG
jgi:hypothetical protein